MDSFLWKWASLFSVASVTSSWWFTGEFALTALGIIIALLTIVERIYTIRIKRKQLKD